MDSTTLLIIILIVLYGSRWKRAFHAPEASNGTL